MQTKSFEATAELVAQVKAGVAACTDRTVTSEEGTLVYLFKNIDFFIDETENGLTLSSPSAGAADFFAEEAWVAGVLEGKDPNEKPAPAPKAEFSPVPVEVVNPAPAMTATKPAPATFAVPATAVKAAIADCSKRTVTSEEGALVYLYKNMDFILEETADGFTLTSPSAGPADFYCEAAWVESKAAPAPKKEAPKEEKPAPAPKPEPKPAPKPAPKSEPVMVCPGKKECDNQFMIIAGVAAIAGLLLIRKIFKH